MLNLRKWLWCIHIFLFHDILRSETYHRHGAAPARRVPKSEGFGFTTSAPSRQEEITISTPRHHIAYPAIWRRTERSVTFNVTLSNMFCIDIIQYSFNVKYKSETFGNLLRFQLHTHRKLFSFNENFYVCNFFH